MREHSSKIAVTVIQAQLEIVNISLGFCFGRPQKFNAQGSRISAQKMKQLLQLLRQAASFERTGRTLVTSVPTYAALKERQNYIANIHIFLQLRGAEVG